MAAPTDPERARSYDRVGAPHDDVVLRTKSGKVLTGLTFSAGWYRLDGHVPVPIRSDAELYAEWARREAEGGDPWRVARTDFDDGRSVSTVFLGLDHNWLRDGPPVVFETMVFPECEVCVRYSTWEQAAAGHDEVVAAERQPTPPGRWPEREDGPFVLRRFVVEVMATPDADPEALADSLLDHLTISDWGSDTVRSVQQVWVREER